MVRTVGLKACLCVYACTLSLSTTSVDFNCFTDVCAVSVHNVFTTAIELKGKATTRNNQDCQLQVVTVYACRQCACSRQ